MTTPRGWDSVPRGTAAGTVLLAVARGPTTTTTTTYPPSMTRPAKKGAGMLLSFVHALGAARPHSYRSLERELIGELGVLQHSVEHGLERADTKKDCYHRARNDDCSNVGVSPEGDVVPIDAGRCKTYMYWVNDGGGTTDDERQENPPRWVTKRCKNNGSGQCGNTGAGLMQLGVFRQPSVACQSTPGKVVAAEDADAFIFVDVDGTISPLDDANPGITDVAQKNLPDPKQIALLASLVNGFPGKRIAIVLSSSWRNTNSRTNRRRGHTPDTVSEALKMRGLALTAVLDPEPDMGWSPYGTFQTDRGWECMRFLAQHGKLGTPYVHLDDDAFDELFLGEWLGGGGPGKPTLPPCPALAPHLTPGPPSRHAPCRQGRSERHHRDRSRHRGVERGAVGGGSYGPGGLVCALQREGFPWETQPGRGAGTDQDLLGEARQGDWTHQFGREEGRRAARGTGHLSDAGRPGGVPAPFSPP